MAGKRPGFEPGNAERIRYPYRPVRDAIPPPLTRGTSRGRTCDLPGFNRPLYLLSYSPLMRRRILSACFGGSFPLPDPLRRLV